MTKRENYLSIIKRTGYKSIPVSYSLCPYLRETYGVRIDNFKKEHGIEDDVVNSKGIQYEEIDREVYKKYFDPPLKEGADIDIFGVGHEKGSEAAMHMTYMRNPLEHMESLEELKAYPYPKLIEDEDYLQSVKTENEKYKTEDKIITGNMQCTVWERAWYMRSMEMLMMDMMSEPELAEFVLDVVVDIAIKQAEFFAKTGCDILFFGDDIGMQKTIMMSEELYVEWLKPRLKKVADAARAINPNIIVFYHSCGFVEPFIDHLIEAGVDVLNPVQPECMDFSEIHAKYGDKISFHGTIGTQTTMPLGTPEEVREEVFKNLRLAGQKGGLLPCPTHILEPEVPVENIEAYLLACKEFKL